MLRPPHLIFFDNLVLRILSPWSHRYGLVAAQIEGRLYELFPNPEQLEKNLVVWYHQGDIYSRWILSFIRYVQLKMRNKHGLTFVLRIYANGNSALLPGKKSKKEFPYGDLWAYEDPLVQVIAAEDENGGRSEYLARHFENVKRLYVIVGQPVTEFSLGSNPVTRPVALPSPKFECDIKAILNYLMGFAL